MVAMNRGAPSNDARTTVSCSIAVDLVLEPAHAAVEQSIDRVRLSGAKPAHVDRRCDRRDQRRRIRRLDHVVVEQMRNRRARGHEPAQEIRILLERDVARPARTVSDGSAADTIQNADERPTMSRPMAGITYCLRMGKVGKS